MRTVVAAFSSAWVGCSLFYPLDGFDAGPTDASFPATYYVVPSEVASSAKLTVNPMAAGDLFVVGVFWLGDATVAVSDSQNQLWAFGQIWSSGGSEPDHSNLQLFYVTSILPGTHTITATQVPTPDGGSCCAIGLYGAEYAGHFVMDGTGGGGESGGAPSTAIVVDYTTHGSRDLAVGLFGDSSGVAPEMSLSTGFIIEKSDSTSSYESIFVDNGPAFDAGPGAYTATATFASGAKLTGWEGVMMAFSAQ
jgi:hypothetical protein